MAILVKTDNPKKLVRDINEGIEQGKIDTWAKDREGNYTHSRPQWMYHAWMHPYIYEDRVVFGILGRSDAKLTTAEYAVYHGRFAEMLLSHFDQSMSSIIVSPGATQFDKF